MLGELAHQVSILTVNTSEYFDGRPELQDSFRLSKDLDNFFAQSLDHRFLDGEGVLWLGQSKVLASTRQSA